MTSPESISAGVEELLFHAKRLGLVPVYRLGSVLATPAAGTGAAMVTLDGDIEPVRCFNLSGPRSAGDRVLTAVIKPQGVYIFGSTSAPPNPRAAFLNQASGVGNTTSATYVSLPGSPSVSFTKSRADTALEIDMRVGSFVSGVGATRPSFAVSILGVNYEIVSQTISPVSTHTSMSGVRSISGIAAGPLTVAGLVLRAAGTGTLQFNAEDWLTIYVREVFV